MPAISFSGIASGIDADAIIKATQDARRSAYIPLENQVSFNEEESTSLQEFNSKLLSLSDSLKDFMTLTGGAVERKASSSNPDAVAVTASSAAIASTHSFTVEQVAKSAFMSFAGRFSTPDALVDSTGAGGTVSFTFGQGDEQKAFSVEVGSGTTLADLALALNDQGAGVFNAAVINVGTAVAPSYALTVSGVQMGSGKGEMAVALSGGLAAASSLGAINLEQASDAVLNVTGLGQITRSSNTISDVIPGVTLSLKGPTGLVTTSVTSDTDATTTKVEEFVTKLNELIAFAAEKNVVERVETERGVTNKYSSLAKTNVDNQALSAIREAISSVKSSSGGSAQILADLGITIQRDGSYKFDKATFKESLASDEAGVQSLLQSFADKVSGSQGIIADYTKYQGQIERAVKSNETENQSASD
ncbi:MAG: flagellar filament capping protein FliD, partial [bacterium]|nr:flagellar filament capping protein FliD [bacterium]